MSRTALYVVTVCMQIPVLCRFKKEAKGIAEELLSGTLGWYPGDPWFLSRVVGVVDTGKISASAKTQIKRSIGSVIPYGEVRLDEHQDPLEVQDHLGGKRDPKPDLDKLARESIYFKEQIKRVLEILDLPHVRLKKLLDLAAMMVVEPAELARHIVSITKEE